MSYYDIKKVCIVGSGVMGTGIATLLASTGQQVLLLDIVLKNSQDKNALVRKAKENIENYLLDNMFISNISNLINVGNLEDDLDLLFDCDLIIEAVVEQVDIKRDLYNKIIPYLKNDAILASNTSTITLFKLKEFLPDTIQSRFVITHFFNPPLYMELLELVLDNKVTDVYSNKLTDFLVKKLKKTVIICNDTPGFVANRIGCYLLEMIVRESIIRKYNPNIVDKIFIDIFLLPKTGIFGLYDMIGLDVMALISGSLKSLLPTNDDYHNIYINTPILNNMVKNNFLGKKVGGGFYRSIKNGSIELKEVIDFETFTYLPVQKIKSTFFLKNLLFDKNGYGDFVQDIFLRFYLYLMSLIPTVVKDIYDIDKVMRLGYGWKIGPFELLTKTGYGFHWIEMNAKNKPFLLNQYFLEGKYRSIDTSNFYSHKINFYKKIKLLSNQSGELSFYSDKLCFSIKTKMNLINFEVLELLLKAVNIAEEKKCDLYIVSFSDVFSVGADLEFIKNAILNKEFDLLEKFLILGQKVMMRLKYSQINIISSVIGTALGGGCELLLHSDFIIANQKTKAGLVEVGIGLIPSWGGTKEMILRGSRDISRFLKNIKNILSYKKSYNIYSFINDYDLINIKVNLNKDLLHSELLEIKLPKKSRPPVSIVELPEVILFNEFDFKEYNEFQIWILSKLQDLIFRKKVTEQELLDFERHMFLSILQDPKKKLFFN